MHVIYESPSLEIVDVNTDDIISTSGGRDAVLPDDEF